MHNDKKKKRFWQDYEPIEKFNFFLMIFTGLLVAVGILQVCEFVQSERASLIVTGFAFQDGLVANKAITLVIPIKNSGRSTGVINDFDASASSLLPNPRPRSHLSSISVSPIAAGDTESGLFEPKYTETQPLILSDADVDNINAKRNNFYVFGTISYEDAFSTLFGDQKISFCYVYLPDRSTSKLTRVSGCPMGN